MNTVFTSPGKIGDAIHQAPIAYWWSREHSETVEMWLDEKTCAPLVPLFAAQPWVSAVKLIGGITGYQCGGQPFHFNLDTKEFADRTIYHLGFRQFPERQITMETLAAMPFNLEVDAATLAETPCFTVPQVETKSRVVLHGTGICPHNNQTPTFWRFLAGIRNELHSIFDETVFVGTDRERRMALEIYPNWTAFVDNGDFLKLASFLADSELVIACGSCVAALAGALKVPCIRVHDPIGESSLRIWDNLGANQLNQTERELRRLWPEWRDAWVRKKVPA